MGRSEPQDPELRNASVALSEAVAEFALNHGEAAVQLAREARVARREAPRERRQNGGLTWETRGNILAFTLETWGNMGFN
jgi:hypothetical protein